MSRGGPRGLGRKCTYVRENGEVCTAWALKDSPEGEELCRVHRAMRDGTWSDTASKMARRQAAKRKDAVDAAPSAGLNPGVSFADVASVCADALQATDVLGYPDYSVRLTACAVLLSGFSRWMRREPEQVEELLCQLIPPTEFEVERMKAQEVYTAARREYDKVPAWHPLRGIVARPYPSAYVAPWEDPREVAKEAPADISPTDPRVLPLSNGRVAMRQERRFPVMLEPLAIEDETDGEDTEVEAAVPAW